MKTVEEKLFDLAPEFVREVRTLQPSDIDGRLATLAKNAEEVEQAMEADDKLNLARAQASEFAAPYRDAKKLLKLKTKFLVQLLQE